MVCTKYVKTYIIFMNKDNFDYSIIPNNLFYL